jgi:uncharacterized protein (DUF433 family)
METIIESINLIATNPQIRGGRPCIAGTTLEVAVIAIAKISGGLEPEEIAADYNLSLPQVYAALSYYYDHKPAIDATIQERRQLAQTMKEARVGSRYTALSG